METTREVSLSPAQRNVIREALEAYDAPDAPTRGAAEVVMSKLREDDQASATTTITFDQVDASDPDDLRIVNPTPVEVSKDGETVTLAWPDGQTWNCHQPELVDFLCMDSSEDRAAGQG